jgi:hypothetical protein
MADTGFKTSGTVVSAGTWSNFTTTRLGTSDDSRASTAATAFDAGVLRNFNFGVPAGAIIDGIEVEFQLSPSNAGDTATARVSLSHNAGTNYTPTSAEQTASGSTTDQTKTVGGPNDTWGRTWTADEINDNTNFYVKLEGKNSTGGARNSRVDYVFVKVYYTLNVIGPERWMQRIEQPYLEKPQVVSYTRLIINSLFNALSCIQ